ncbi:MAG: TOTE conflict system archaeo-eukaryotic primase domain-containing protein [Acidimicrobiales bacterium]
MTVEPELVRAREELEACRRELRAARAEIGRLRALLGLDRPVPDAPGDGRLFAPDALPRAVVSAGAGASRVSAPEEKLALFGRLFAARTDVFALRWENRSTGKAGWMPARTGGRDGPLRTLTDAVLRAHLEGRDHVGVYPLRQGDVCTLLACDFDGASWALDARAFHDAAVSVGLAPLLERSRSGGGAHVWLFFSEPVPAASARRLGAGLLRRAMDERVELDLASYDRLFPSQDNLPRQGFGNLIALPLHGECRRRGTTVFLDPTTLEPYDDQWAVLGALEPVDRSTVERLAGELDPFERVASHRPPAVRAPVPSVVRAELGAGVSFDRIGLPAWLVAELKHAASLPNPAFFEKQRMRFSTWDTPRVIRCYRESLDRLELPRGLLDEARSIVEAAGAALEVSDRRTAAEPVGFRFRGQLRADQQTAVDALVGHDHGMLIAPPGTGKTVIGCALIAAHQRPTLVLVDRRPLAEQWRERLGEFLGLEPRQIGQRGGGRSRTSGIVDIALLQSLARYPERAGELFGRYGLVVVDECHHAPAASYEPILAAATTRRWVGLTATPFRADRLDPLIAFYCGPIRHEIPAADTPSAELPRQLHVHTTELTLEADTPHIQDVFRALAHDETRNRLVVDNLASLVRGGRNVLVLSQRKDHLDALGALLSAEGIDPLLLVGGRTRTQSRAVIAELTERARRGDGVIALATGSYLGEGFDLPGLDTLVLAFPVSFKGRVIQYVGRLLRADPAKTDIAVHDYHDPHVAVLVAMARKRLATYRQLGFTTPAQLPATAPSRPDDAF